MGGGGDFVKDGFVEERRRLRELLRSRSLRTGEFVLASGARSNYYIDARLTTMAGAGQLLVGSVGLGTLDANGWKPACIGGLTLGADPISYAIVHAAALQGRSIDAFTVRKEAKGHGAGRLIEGGFRAGAAVVITEDVITTGDSAARAINAVRKEDGKVIGVLALVDREEGGRERLESEGVLVSSLFTTGELLGQSD
jgi:orotate phosphoribosyltransferase